MLCNTSLPNESQACLKSVNTWCSSPLYLHFFSHIWWICLLCYWSKKAYSIVKLKEEFLVLTCYEFRISYILVFLSCFVSASLSCQFYLQCKYTAFGPSELCKSESHTLKVVNTFKRFFKCGHCSNRTMTLDLVPLEVCRNCGRSRWERAAMLKVSKILLMLYTFLTLIFIQF